MPKPSESAISLLHEIGWSEPCDMNIEEIAWYCGLVVKFKEMNGSQGRIIMNQNEGIISINSSINYQPKINYIIAHEIGHSRLHRNLPLFSDSEKTLSDWYAKGPHETEANQFAEEILMPEELFRRKVKRKPLDLYLIEDLAGYFGTSKTATFLRYRSLGDFPVMIIFVEDGIIKWKSMSHDFPYKWLPLGSKLAPFTVAGDYYYKQVEENRPARVDAIEWFPEDFTCQKNIRAKLWEQCFPGNQNSIVTCLWAA